MEKNLELYEFQFNHTVYIADTNWFIIECCEYFERPEEGIQEFPGTNHFLMHRDAYQIFLNQFLIHRACYVYQDTNYPFDRIHSRPGSILLQRERSSEPFEHLLKEGENLKQFLGMKTRKYYLVKPVINLFLGNGEKLLDEEEEWDETSKES